MSVVSKESEGDVPGGSGSLDEEITVTAAAEADLAVATLDRRAVGDRQDGGKVRVVTADIDAQGGQAGTGSVDDNPGVADRGLAAGLNQAALCDIEPAVGKEPELEGGVEDPAGV